MKMIKIGGDIASSAVSLGCMRMSALNEKGVDEIMDCAIESGVNFFDHADIYGRGESERLFGEYLKRNTGVRDKILIQTKCAIHDGQYDFSKEHILRSVDGSLARLGVDYVDFLLLCASALQVFSPPRDGVPLLPTFAASLPCVFALLNVFAPILFGVVLLLDAFLPRANKRFFP